MQRLQRAGGHLAACDVAADGGHEGLHSLLLALPVARQRCRVLEVGLGVVMARSNVQRLAQTRLGIVQPSCVL